MKPNKVYCFFEQSGTFKNEFLKLGIDAIDCDIQNSFSQTDCVIDLFAEIERGFDNFNSIFDEITADDLIIAFFPCIYFGTLAQMDFCLKRHNTEQTPLIDKLKYAINKLNRRSYFHTLLYKLVAVCDKNKIPLIIENPATAPNYLIQGQNFPPPTFIDKNRRLRGDYFIKPTAYWFFNCSPTFGKSYATAKIHKKISSCERTIGNEMCSSERSLVSSEYAKNFICDFIIGKKQTNSLPNLFLESAVQ